MFSHVFIYQEGVECTCFSVWVVRTLCRSQVPSFCYVDAGDGTVVIRRGSKYLYPLNHATGPRNGFLQALFLHSVALRTICNTQTWGGTVQSQCSTRGLLMPLSKLPTPRRRPPSVLHTDSFSISYHFSLKHNYALAS